MVNHTLFLANILDFLLCLPSTLSFGFITSQSNFNSATKSGWRKIHSSADLHHVKNMITNFKWALVFTLQSGYISYLHFLNISQFSSVTQSGPTLQPHQVQHARPPCPSPIPGVYSNSCPSSGWCHPAISSVVPFSSCHQSLPASGSFSNESTLCIRWPKYWSFSFNISPSNEHPGPISFRMDWLDLLAVRGTLKSLLQHHSSKASILWCSAFFIVQLSHPYMTTGKTIALTRHLYQMINSYSLLNQKKTSTSSHPLCLRTFNFTQIPHLFFNYCKWKILFCFFSLASFTTVLPA